MINLNDIWRWRGALQLVRIRLDAAENLFYRIVFEYNVPQLSYFGKNYTFYMSSLKDIFTAIKGSDFE